MIDEDLASFFCCSFKLFSSRTHSSFKL